MRVDICCFERAAVRSAAHVDFELVAQRRGTRVRLRQCVVKPCFIAALNPALDPLLLLRNSETLRRLTDVVTSRGGPKRCSIANRPIGLETTQPNVGRMPTHLSGGTTMSEREPSGLHASSLFDRVAAKAKKTAGRLIGKQDFTEEGELQEAKAQTAADAARLGAEAEQRRLEAEVAADEEANRIATQRADAELSRVEREEQLGQAQKAAEAHVDQEFTRRRAAVGDKARRDDEMITEEEHVATATRLDGTLEAAAINREAKQAEAAAEALEDAQRELEHEKNGE